MIRDLLKDDDWGVQEAAINAVTVLGSESEGDLDSLAEISAETCAVMEEPMKALGELDWKLYSPYSLIENQR